MKIQVAYGRFDPDDPDARRGRAYTYWTTESLDVGDVVLVPGNWLKPTTQEATVVALDSDYDGPLDRVLRVLERKQEAS